MTILINGARQLPLRHISIRVPWNDTGWNGVVCKRPAENISCLILKNIRANRKDDSESKVAGQSWETLSADHWPACMSEHGHFMADFEMTRRISHPYTQTSKAHEHLLPTPYRYPPYSAACTPFAWMLKESAEKHVKNLELGFQAELEDNAHEAMEFRTEWLQTKHNQRVLLDTFFSAIQPDRSLAFFYAKNIPFIEDNRRIIIGVGWVKNVGEPVEYRYSGPGLIEAILWERNVQHSIRPGFMDGFLLPYHDVQEYLDTHPDENPMDYMAFVPDDQFWSFSYGSEHVTNDGAIGVLLSCAKALQNCQKIVPGPWEHALKWIDSRLNELWTMRGPCPGLGAALSAFGVENGSLIAHELERIMAENPSTTGRDPWMLVDQLFREPTAFTNEMQKRIGATLRQKWVKLSDQRRMLLKLLSRFELTADQATRYYVHEDKRRAEFGIEVTDEEIISNLYHLYEIDRIAPDPISLSTIDRGVFPDQHIRDEFPLTDLARIDDPLDSRRVRAFLVQQLEEAAKVGNTLGTRADIIRAIRELDTQPGLPLDNDTMELMEDSLSPEVFPVSLANGQSGYQLARMSRVAEVIRSAVQKRLRGVRHSGHVNWRECLDRVLKGPAAEDDLQEQNARREKTAALEELFASRFSVLIGPAGTGKTTLLKVLCQDEQVQAGGVLLLAPTGKARVRMEVQAGLKGAKTIAQFLLPIKRYDYETGRYHLSDHPKVDSGKTVIIDEASMLTEEQLAAVLDGLKGVERLILVGDPRQLPPIGAGRPFLDIVRELAPENIESRFPRIGYGYAELTVRRRQKGSARDDLLLAEWFSGRPLDAGADEIWDRIRDNTVSQQLRFVRWDTPDELKEKMLDILVEELNLEGKNDAKGFELSLGGSQYNNGVYFWVGRDGQPGACEKVENWQILTPVRGAPQGVDALNRLIQATFRARTKEFANQQWRKIPKPMGREEILYGDKVINVINHRRYKVYPEKGALQYLANGEIGIVVGQYRTKNITWMPNKLEVEFSSQPGYKYDFFPSDFKEEGSTALELAYSLTIHKVQGSEFGTTFVVLPNPCRILSRELLYTALTRQRDRIIIMHQGERHALKTFSDEYYSEAAKRLTNLFRAPNPVELQDRFLEDGLIHKTRRGESVRSKSEVIIANLLHGAGLDYEYEYRLIGPDGSVRYPDFRIEDAETGQVIYWEHLGMMNDPSYQERWEQKLIWYRTQGILPIDEGGGPAGMLVVTEDDERGGIDSGKIEQLIINLFK